MAKKVRAGRKRRVVAAGITVAGVLAAGTVAAGPASAASAPLEVASTGCGPGSLLTWNSTPDPVLTVGTAAAGACGGTEPNPAYASMTFVDMVNTAVPAVEPTFTGNFGAGTPFMTIELRNGQTLTGYPGVALSGQSGPDAAGMAWSADGSSTLTGYQTAYQAAGAAATTTRQTSIRTPSGAATGTKYTLTSVQYDGEVVGPGTVTVAPVGAQVMTIGQSYDHWISASTTSSDPNGVTITGVTGLPGGLYFTSQQSPASGYIEGNVVAGAQSGTMTVTATDAYGVTGTEEIPFTVNPAPVPPPVPVLSHGKAVATSPTRETVTWQQTVPSWEQFKIVGPGAINGHVGWVPPGTTIAYYGGLEAHHGYTVTYTPCQSKNGPQIQEAIPGKVYFVS